MLKAEIQQELKKAVKGGDEINRSTLRMVLAAVSNKEKEKRYKEKAEAEVQLTEEEMIEVISSEAKKRKEAIREYEKGGRQDLAEKEKAELKILEKYLPEQLSEEAIRKLAQQAVEKTKASEMKDMGKVMAELMPQVKGKADGAIVSQIVKELLSPK
ncbi:MAG: GatB/YqeY domain-containing protein [bacterium]|nr:GatB/YqeY domain-containing protein [bacterium]